MLRFLFVLSLLAVSSCAPSDNISHWKQGDCVRITGDKRTYSMSEAAQFERNTPKPSIQNEYLLGLMYAELSSNPDWKKSAYWMQKSAQAGYPAAQTSLGKLYLNGTGVPKNVAEAYFWLRAGQSPDCESSGYLRKAEQLLSPSNRLQVEERLGDKDWLKPRAVNWN